LLSEELLERADERALLGRALNEARAGRGRLVLIEGEAGIGKTALLELAMRLVAERGLALFSARGGALEEGFGYGIVRQLFESALLAVAAPRRRKLLEGPAARAGPVFGLAGRAKPASDPLHAAHATQAALARSLVRVRAQRRGEAAAPLAPRTTRRSRAYAPRFGLDRLEHALTAAAPCPPEVRELFLALGL